MRETQDISADRVRELALEKIHAGEKPRGKKLRRPAAVILAAALALALSAAALAAVFHGDFFKDVFGRGVAGQQAFDVVLDDGTDGGIAKTEHYPATERVEVDGEKAEELVGDYVSAVGQSVTLGKYTFTVEDALLDENGIGAVTVHVENPDGHNLSQSGKYDQAAGEYVPFTVNIERESGEYRYMDTRSYLVTESFTETEATYVYYFTPFEPLQAGEELTMTFSLRQDSDYPEWPRASIVIPSADKVPSRSFADEKARCYISPVGMTLIYDTDLSEGESRTESEIIIRYTDGSDYTLKAADLHNISVSSLSREGDTVWMAFNRLADTDNIAEIRIAGNCRAADNAVNSFVYELTAAD